MPFGADPLGQLQKNLCWRLFKPISQRCDQELKSGSSLFAFHHLLRMLWKNLARQRLLSVTCIPRLLKRSMRYSKQEFAEEVCTRQCQCARDHKVCHHQNGNRAWQCSSLQKRSRVAGKSFLFKWQLSTVTLQTSSYSSSHPTGHPLNNAVGAHSDR